MDRDERVPVPVRERARARVVGGGGRGSEEIDSGHVAILAQEGADGWQLRPVYVYSAMPTAAFPRRRCCGRHREDVRSPPFHQLRANFFTWLVGTNPF